MLQVVFSRIAGSLAAIFGASVLSFVILRKLPGDPARLVLGPLAPASSVRAYREHLGLDQPIWVQYWRFMRAFFTGDWGYAYSAGSPVTTLMRLRLPATIELGIYSFLLAFVFALVLALLATYRRRPVTDASVRLSSFVGYGTPPFYVALILLIVFSTSWLHILPGPEGRLSPGATPPPAITHLYTVDALLEGRFNTFWDALQHLILPAISLGIAEYAFLVRLLRANLLEVSREPFILVARGKGVGRFTAFRRHALPNAFLPTLTASGLILGQFLAGSVLVEKIFDWPGVGALVVDAILRQDFAVVQTFILLSAVVFVVVNLLVDLLSGVIDPRVRIPVGGSR
jgi:ABC-type dipeptide/oligopeptide/nickel transport system permease component